MFRRGDEKKKGKNVTGFFKEYKMKSGDAHFFGKLLPSTFNRCYKTHAISLDPNHPL